VKVVLRIIAVHAGVSGLLFAAMALPITSIAVLQHGLIGPLMLALEWSMSAMGLFGAVQLWRLRERGRRAVASLEVLTFLLPIIARQQGVVIGYGDLPFYGISVAALCVLLSKRARDLCAATGVPVLQPKAEVDGGAA
jgi:hypothetical protein